MSQGNSVQVAKADDEWNVTVVEDVRPGPSNSWSSPAREFCGLATDSALDFPISSPRPPSAPERRRAGYLQIGDIRRPSRLDLLDDEAAVGSRRTGGRRKFRSSRRCCRCWRLRGSWRNANATVTLPGRKRESCRPMAGRALCGRKLAGGSVEGFSRCFGGLRCSPACLVRGFTFTTECLPVYAAGNSGSGRRSETVLRP